MQKLDTISKILLATQSINYMATSLSRVTEQCKTVSSDDVVRGMVTNNENALLDHFNILKAAMMQLGDYMNSIDCVCPIDARILKPAFDIIARDRDDVNT